MVEGTALTPQTRRRRIIERPRLTQLLDTGQGRIKLLVGPAGYGKTTLARQWLEGKEATWYRGTAASADVAALAAGIRGAVAAVVPDAGAALMERLPVTRRPEEEAHVLAEMLAADLPDWPAEAWLVFDEYQMIAGTIAAERFVESLLLEAPLNVLLMTRQRPSWASSRRILYGDVFEVDRAALAMTDEEARELLAGNGPETAEIVEVAQGWPAVLSLASMASVPPPDLSAAPHLYGFFAEEIYQRIDRRARRILCELALYDVEGRRLAIAQLRSEEADRVVKAGVDSGFLTESSDGRLDMHPLLRAFLERKLTEERPKTVGRTVARAVENLIAHELWDEAFELTERLQSKPGPLLNLIDAAMRRLLSSGRTSTLRSWVERAPSAAPAVRLASAELAFREGRFYESESLAALAATDPDIGSDLAVRLHLAAGRAAHAASRETAANAHYESAAEAAQTDELKRIAAFGQLATALELERPEAERLLGALGPPESLEPDERVILVNRMINLQTRFGLPISLEQGRAMWQLLHLVADPLSRTSFRNVFAYVLAAMGHCDEATRLNGEQLEEAELYRLPFVVPYARTVQALIEFFGHDYARATESVDLAEELALRSGDQTAYHISWAVRTRLYIAQGAFDLALSRAIPRNPGQTQSLDGELLSCYAVALAGAGDLTRARDYAARALGMSRAIEIAVSAPCALAIAAIRTGDHEEALAQARRALAACTTSGMIDCFVAAYRGCPELVVCLLEDVSLHDDLARVLATAGDASDVATQGMITAGGHKSVLSLSKREKEVLALLARGLTNPEIGQALFISPVTVKVHVRHIFDKLGVKSRAAAAMRAAQLNRDL